MEALWKFYFTFGLAMVCFFPLLGARVKTKQFTCPQQKFKCRGTEKCIPSIWKCDGDDDCGDRSDEMGCEVRKCKPLTQFTCASNQKCVPRRWKCDGEKDCADGSDELNCPTPACAKEFFKCNNSKCVPNRWKCDKQDDCGDKSDETGCPLVSKTCDKDKDARCTDGTCISSAWKCDGENDCKDGSDERNCTTKIRKCKTKEYTCTNKQCIPKKWRCDGSTDCYDHSDELNCPNKKQKTCGSLFWTCKNGDCIKNDWRCDGEDDCRDGSDEKNCTVITCPSNKFQCNSDKKCIPQHLRCDNTSDCADNSDEKGCSTSKINCGPKDFNCSFHECVSYDKVCDNHKDCLNGEDEPRSCNINECLDNKGHCSQNCTDLTLGYKCSCAKGFTLDNDGRTCTDVDECKEYGTCHQICQNVKGHYKCSCGMGYQLHKDHKTCKPEGMQEWIYFSNRVDIRRVSANGRNYEIVVSNIRGAVSIDFDMRRKRIYWTDILSDQIQSADIDGGSPRLVWNTGRNKSVVMKHVHTPDGLALDWINDKLYWTDTGYKTIEVSDLDGNHNMDIVQVGLNEPRAISVDPFQGFVYWTDWGSSASIERISMDGDIKTRKKVVDKNIYWPNGLTLDLNQGKVYWIDAKLKRMEVADLDGQNRKVIKATGFKHPFAIDNFAEQVYWTDWKSDKLTSMSKFDSSKINIIKNGLFAPMDVKVFHKSKQPRGTNRCDVNKNGCSHLCLLANKNGVPSSSCKCPRGMTLSGITTCVGTHKPHTSRHGKPTPLPPKKGSATTQTVRERMPTKPPSSIPKHGKPGSRTINHSGNMGTGTIIAILLSILIVIMVLCGFVWYKRRHVGKTNVKYYKDMSKKPLEDDFDITADDLDDMAQIDSDPYNVVGS